MMLEEIDGLSEAFIAQQIRLDREVAARSFYEFYKMIWSLIDPEPFVDGRHIELICHHLQQAARREIRRLCIAIPPRHSKSILCSVAFPAWVWTWWPSAKFITASYGLSLATRDATAARRLIEHPWYQARWPLKFMGDQNIKTHYQTQAGGVRFVCSPGTGITGHGSDFNIFDDPHDITKAESDPERLRAMIFWFETMSGRFNNPARGIGIVIQQRVHERDVAGECIRRNYYQCVLPARFEAKHPQRHPLDWRGIDGEPLWPQKFTDSVLDGLWKELGGVDGYAVAGQQQQRPQPRQGGLFKRHWFKVVPDAPPGTHWVRAWDLAATEAIGGIDPDWTVGCKFGFDPASKTYFIGDIQRDRLDPGGTLRMVKRVATQDTRDVTIFLPQDPGQAGKQQVQHYVQELAGWTVKFNPMTGSKATRAAPLASQAEIGAVMLVEGAWNEDFLAEITAFPSGMHDDQVDAAACGFTMFLSSTTGMLDFLAEEAGRTRQAQEDLRRSMGINVVRDYVPQSLR